MLNIFKMLIVDVDSYYNSALYTARHQSDRHLPDVYVRTGPGLTDAVFCSSSSSQVVGASTLAMVCCSACLLRISGATTIASDCVQKWYSDCIVPARTIKTCIASNKVGKQGASGGWFGWLSTTRALCRQSRQRGGATWHVARAGKALVVAFCLFFCSGCHGLKNNCSKVFVVRLNCRRM